MSEMVERVAKAIAWERRGKSDSARDPDHLWAHLYSEQEIMLRCASAAVAAMREPTPEMIRAGELTLTEPTDISGYPCACSEEAVWKAMIDAAGKKDGAATD